LLPVRNHEIVALARTYQLTLSRVSTLVYGMRVVYVDLYNAIVANVSNVLVSSSFTYDVHIISRLKARYTLPVFTARVLKSH